MTESAPANVLFRLDLPWPRPPLRSNDSHGNYYAQAKKVREVREAVMLLAKHAKIPKGQHLTVQLFYAPGTRQRMDSHNLHPTVKAGVDALATPGRKINPRNPRSRPWIGLQLVPDDTDDYVTILEPRIVRPPVPGPRCWLTVEVRL